MKIRTDFVTNSSSSSYITITMQNQEFLTKLHNTGLGKIGFTEDDDNFFDDSPKEVEEFVDAYFAAYFERSCDYDIADFYKDYLRDKYQIDCKTEDFYIEKYNSCWGEVFGFREEIERDYGVACDRVVSESDSRTGKTIMELEDISHITEEALENIISGNKTINSYLGQLETTERCLKTIVRAYENALLKKGKTTEEVQALLGDYSELIKIKIIDGVVETE